jgi:DNA-nicking Smr family endonuclease
MKKNKYPQEVIINDYVDLHGMTDYEAVESVEKFIKNSRDSHFKTVKIIIGKGLNSIGEPILKKITREVLIQQNLKFTTAKIQEGGSGAFIVNL